MYAQRFCALVLVVLPSTLFAEAPRVDSFGDPLPTGVKMRLGTLRFRALSPSVSVALSPDGRILATGESGAVRFWDLSNGTELRCVTLQHLEVQFIVFSSDSKRFAVAGLHPEEFSNKADIQHSVFVGDVATGAILHKMHGESGTVAAPVFSPDGRFLVSRPDLTLWECATGKIVHRFDKVRAYAFSPDGKHLAGVRADGKGAIWDAVTGREVKQVGNALPSTSVVRFSADSGTLAVAACAAESKKCTIELCDVASSEKPRHLDVSCGSVRALSFIADGKKMIVRDAGSHLLLLETDTGRQLARFPDSDSLIVSSYTFSHDGKLLAWAEGSKYQDLDESTYYLWQLRKGPVRSIHLWDVATGKELRRWTTTQLGVAGLHFTPDGSVLIAGGTSLSMWNVSTGLELPLFVGHQNGIEQVRYSADGKQIASLDYNGRLCLWDAATGAARRLAFRNGEEATRYFRFSADSQSLTTVGLRKVHVWAMGEKTQPLHFWQTNDVILRATFSPDGRHMATVEGELKTIRLRELTTGKVLKSLSDDASSIEFTPEWLFDGKSSVEFSPDGRYLAVHLSEILLAVWDCGSGQRVGLLDIKDREPAFSFNTGIAFAFSPHGSLLAWVRRDKVHLWDLARQREVWQVRAHQVAVGDLAFSPDGKWLVTCGVSDFTMRVWETASGKELRRHDLPADVAFHGPIRTTPKGILLVHVTYDSTDRHSFRDAWTGREVAAALARSWDMPVFSPDRRVTVTPRLMFYDATTGRPLGRLPRGRREAYWGAALAFSPDGGTLATGSRDSTIQLRDVSSLQDEWPQQLVTYTDADLEAIWHRLADDEYNWEDVPYLLLAAPRQAPAFLAAKLRATPIPDPVRITGLIADLNDDTFEKREAATQELAKLGKLADRDLRMALAAKPSAEMKRRIAELFAVHGIAQNMAPEMRSAAGAIRVLELLGTAPARKVLEETARGPATAWLTVEAKEALRRLKSVN